MVGPRGERLTRGGGFPCGRRRTCQATLQDELRRGNLFLAHLPPLYIRAAHLNAEWRLGVTVAGRVVRVRARTGGGWRVRLAETGGALEAAEIRPSHPLPLPMVGARIVIRGQLLYDRVHGWYAVDPVVEWREVRGT